MLDGPSGDQPRLISGIRHLNTETLRRVVEALASELDATFAPGARLLLATRDQFAFALFFLAALRSHTMPLLADPAAETKLQAMAERWGAVGGLGSAASAAVRTRPGIDDERVYALVDAPPPQDLKIPFAAADTPAFWTFTSGTTGESRAIVHGHSGPVAAFASFASGTLRMGPADRTIATAGLPFVYALGNALLFPLMAGASAIVPRDLLLPTILGELARHSATLLVSSPWSLDAIARLARRPAWVAALTELRLALSAGEALPTATALRWRARFGGEVIDNLGCTEMFNSFLSQEPGRTTPGYLGRVVAGFEVRIAGAAPEPGARGALAVRGASRALALSDREGSPPCAPQGTFCETGDEVELTESGEYRFLGRLDDRFKVRGQFVYPLEVERCLLEVEGVDDLLAFEARDASGLAALALQIVAVPGQSHEELAKTLRRHARSQLPGHLRPTDLAFVSELPRSARGKLLRQAGGPVAN